MSGISEQTFLDTNPLTGSVGDLDQIAFQQVRGENEEPLWNELIQRYHYLGYAKMVGAGVKYLVRAGQRIIAAISWSAAAWKVEVRDCFIGWSERQKRANLLAVSNNTRFLILPWVRVKNLASHLLSRCSSVLSSDWYTRYGRPLLLLETFVDPERFAATSYRAANWVYVGETKGYVRRVSGYEYHGKVKEVYLYVVEPDFHKILGCEQRPLPRVSLSQTIREGKAEMMIRYVDWDSPLSTQMKVTEGDMEVLAEELIRFHAEFRSCFPQKASHTLGLTYLRGLMSDIERKTAEGIALKLSDCHRVRATQCFMTSYPWDHEAMLDRYAGMLAQQIAQPEGVLTVDSTEFRKKGTHSVGVARQYCGNIGKVDNCQSGVFIGYTSDRGYGLVDRQLYMPQQWFSDDHEQNRAACRVPEGLTFQTKNQIALGLIGKVRQGGLFPARWLACDSSFGRDHEFRDEVGKWYLYLAAVPADTQVWATMPQVRVPPYSGKGHPTNKEKPVNTKAHPLEVRDVAKDPRLEWQRGVALAEGAKGPIVADVARLRVWESRGGLPGPACWLFLRRYENGVIKYALSNAPEETRMGEMTRVAMGRWPIEQGFQDGKSYLGMSHYEHRSWPGWHRHMTYVFLAQLFLLRVRYRFKKNSDSDPSDGQAADRRYDRHGEPTIDATTGARDRSLPCCEERMRSQEPSKEAAVQGEDKEDRVEAEVTQTNSLFKL